MRLSSIAASLAGMGVVFLHVQPVMAALYFFAASSSGTTCSLAMPCAFATAVGKAQATDQISCADSSDNFVLITISKSITIDCSGTAGSIEGITVNGAGAVVTLRNFTIWQFGIGVNLLTGTAILDNVHITGADNAISATPNAPSTLIVKNSTIDSSEGGAVVLSPTGGGSLSVQFDHVTIAGNGGGGIKADSSGGPITADISDSVISNNGGNGFNVTSGTSGQNNMVSIAHTTIAKNGVAGIQAGGSNAAVLLDTSLLDSNADGATTVVNGGRILSYGTNRIVGTAGAGFTGSASLQ